MEKAPGDGGGGAAPGGGASDGGKRGDDGGVGGAPSVVVGAVGRDGVDGGAADGGEKRRTSSSRRAKSIIDPVARALLVQLAIVLAADNDDAEILKTTAQFVALDGKGGTFLRDLTLREWNDPRTFGFLQPRHGDFAYFSALVDLYRRLLAKCVHAKHIHGNTPSLLTATAINKMVGLDPSHTPTAQPTPHPNATFTSSIAHEHAFLQTTSSSVHACLSAAAHRVEHRRHRRQKRRAALQRAAEGGASSTWGGTARIDWHDFVVVETIGFAVDEVVESLPPPPPPPPVVVGAGAGGEEEGETIEVVEDYSPTVVSSRSKLASPSHTHVIDPITKKSIPVADTTEHMRIQLLDPKWAVEKRRFMEKQKDSNYVEGETIARNVDAFARARGGVGEGLFGSSKEELLGREEEG